jgi:hypothetical protein
MNRQEHLEWCKKRAMDYVHEGHLDEALASMLSDLSKHPETQTHSAAQLGMVLKMSGQLDTAEQMRRFIEGFR